MDVCIVVQKFFKQSWILPAMNSNVVSLIPKISGAASVKDFRPIVVTNFKFKTIFKILVDRLAIVAARIISSNQYGFVQGKQIHDCIGIASEVINMLSKKVKGDNVAYKIDIHKAFDTLSWKFFINFDTLWFSFLIC